MSSKLKLGLLAAVCAIWLPAMTGTASAADEQFAVTSIINVPTAKDNNCTPQGLGSFDIGFVDPIAGVYVLADRCNKSIDVVDTSNNAVINQLRPGFAGFTGNNDTSGPDGVLIANHTQVWVGDGNSTVWVLHLHTGKVIAKISTALKGEGTDKTRADEGCYDPKDHIQLWANDASDPAPFVTFISSTSHTVLGHIVMDGKGDTPLATNGIEQCQWSPRTGKFYLNIPQVGGSPGKNDTPGVVLVIDPVSQKIENSFSLAKTGCRGNQGMAIGPDHQILLGCSNSGPDSVIMDEEKGTFTDLKGQSGSDEVWFNPGDNQYFLGNGNHKPDPELGVVDPNASVDTPGASAVGSHSVAADPVKNQIYVPVNNNPKQGGASGICSKHDGSDSEGCIAVFTATGDDPGICVGQGAPVVSMEGVEPVLLKAVCPPKGSK